MVNEIFLIILSIILLIIFIKLIINYKFSPNNCIKCGKENFFILRVLGLAKHICKTCLLNIKNEIIETENITTQQIEFLKKVKKSKLIKIYFEIFKKFEIDNELNEKEINTLERFQNELGLTQEEVKRYDYLLPYVYVNSIRKGELLKVTLNVEGAAQPILKKDEVIHFADNCHLKEFRSVRVGYEGGSSGISFRIAKGVRYYIGGHKGRVITEQRLVPTSQGIFILTNQRILLQPAPGNKAVSIPLKTILSYQCYENGVEICKEGREKPYFFKFNHSGSCEIVGLCLGHLLQNKE